MTKREKFDQQLKGLAIYQIAGGVLGIGFTINTIVEVFKYLTVPLYLLLSVALALFSYSIYCGRLLFKNPGKGLRFSLINQILQVINFAFIGYSFKYISGVFLSVGIDLTDVFSLNFNAGLSSWNIYFNSPDQEIMVNLNIVAVVLVAFVEKLSKQWKQFLLESEISLLLEEPVVSGND